MSTSTAALAAADAAETAARIAADYALGASTAATNIEVAALTVSTINLASGSATTYVTVNGDTMTGDLTGKSISLSGGISGSTGAFTGSVTVASMTSTGNVWTKDTLRLGVSGVSQGLVIADENMKFFADHNTGGSQYFSFGFGDVSSDDRKLVIMQSGNVGIGNTAPAGGLHISSLTAIIDGNVTEKLTLRSNVAAGMTLQSGGTGSDAITRYFDSTNSAYVGLNGGSGCGAGNFSVYASGCRFQVTQAGLIGIGTSAPATTLDVNGNAQFGTTAKSTFSTTGSLTIASSGNLDVPSGVGTFTNSTSTQAVFKGFSSINGANTASGQIFIGNSATAAGFRLSYDNASTGDVYYDSMGDSATFDHVFRTRLNGTSVEGLRIAGSGLVTAGGGAGLKIQASSGEGTSGEGYLDLSAAGYGPTSGAVNWLGNVGGISAYWADVRHRFYCNAAGNGCFNITATAVEIGTMTISNVTAPPNSQALCLLGGQLGHCTSAVDAGGGCTCVAP